DRTWRLKRAAADRPRLSTARLLGAPFLWTAACRGRGAEEVDRPTVWNEAHMGRVGRSRSLPAAGSGKEWCPGRDLNPDELPHTPLKRTRIPIPPPGHQVRCRRLCSGSRGIEVLVPRTGLEPIRPCGHYLLKISRLPISPPRRRSTGTRIGL